MHIESLKDTIVKSFGVELPISGGDGQSVDDPIVIDAEKDAVSIEYKIIQFIHALGHKNYQIESQSLIGQAGKKIDKISVVLADEPKQTRSFYFDITKSF